MSENKKVLLFTDEFPFGYGETFLESEMEIWSKSDNIDLIIIPLLGKKDARLREIPQNAILDTKLQEVLSFYEKRIIYNFPIIFLNPFFWKEIVRLPKVLLNFKKFRKLVAVSVFSLIIAKYLMKHYNEILKNESTVFYSYWFFYAAKAGALLKRKRYKFKLVTRAHGMDIFQNRKDTGLYIPFRRFPIWKYFDRIYPVSQAGANYLTYNQGIPENKLEVSYLGIILPSSISAASSSKTIQIVSCSNLVPVKRVNLIIESLSYYKKHNPEVNIIWNHIGDGPLMKKMNQLAEKRLSELGIVYQFRGQFSNREVFDFYKTNKVDCFLTTSENEGLPVSIMEAMCFGIPILATSVGGIPEAVSEEMGKLIPKDFSQEEFSVALDKMMEFKTYSLRKKIALTSRKKFEAIKNFSLFIKSILSE